MRRLFPLCVFAARVCAAQTQLPSPEKQELYHQLDEIRAAIRSDDWSAAFSRSRLLSRSRRDVPQRQE